MHHKRRSRRRDDRKMLSCGCCYASEVIKTPVEHEICNGKPKAKRPRPKKDKCPVNRVHEWYKETITESHDYWHGFLIVPRPYMETYEKWTCIHCWKEKLKKPRYRSYRRRNMSGGWLAKRYGYYLPKREVKF